MLPAEGAITNCDFFPLRIKQLPFKDSLLQIRYTHVELLEYFRLKTDSFISKSVGVSFSPYNHGGINDSVKYSQPLKNSNGALVHIDMTQDGTVIQSGFVQSLATTNGLPNSINFTFTTIWSSDDGFHPVSGNRRFGIYKDDTRPGEYTFYTMGVDRISTEGFETADKLMSAFTKSGFENADDLWTDMQKI